MSNRVYFCYEKGDFCGLFVIASSRGKAKELFAREVMTDFTEVRSRLSKKEVVDYDEGVIDVGDPLLEKIGLQYCEDEEEF